MTRINRCTTEKDKGFTLTEFLVVIIIVGVLSAIAIPLFLTQEKKAQDATARADVSTLGEEIATWMVDPETGHTFEIIGDGSSYTATAVPAISYTKLGHQTKNVALTTFSTTGANAENWCVQVTNEKGDKSTITKGGFKHSAGAGLEEGAC